MFDRELKVVEFFIKNGWKDISCNEIGKDVNVWKGRVGNDMEVMNSNFMDDIMVSIKCKGYELNRCEYRLERISEG